MNYSPRTIKESKAISNEIRAFTNPMWVSWAVYHGRLNIEDLMPNIHGCTDFVYYRTLLSWWITSTQEYTKILLYWRFKAFLLFIFFTERSCGNPGIPTNGKKNSSSYQYGNSILFECDVGYTLQGSSVRTCQDNGLWTGTQPTCQSELTSVYLTRIVRLCDAEFVLKKC